MTDGIWTVLVATSSVVLGYATWWLVRHEHAVRRFRAHGEQTEARDRR